MNEYAPQWRDYRRRFVITLATWVVPPAAIAVTGVWGTAQTVAIVAWLLAFSASMIWLFSFRCPRCREWFFIKLPSNHPLARACVHCGLPKWAASDPSAPEGGPRPSGKAEP